MTDSTENSIIRWATDTAGRGLARVFAAIKEVRRPRPLHPHGELFEGQVEWLGETGSKSGISWVDSPPSGGRQNVTLRVSRSVGLPRPLPDVIGLAFRLETEQGDADLELASSWLGVPGRFLLRPTLGSTGNFSTVMPYRGNFGPVVIAARTAGPRDGRWDIDLLHATSASKWRRFATVRLDAQPLPDRADLRFDPVLRPVPGAGTYAWTRRLRQRSYAVARRA
jgi:hypothetical protein